MLVLTVLFFYACCLVPLMCVIFVNLLFFVLCVFFVNSLSESVLSDGRCV